MRAFTIALLLASISLLFVPPADARIVRVEITRTESPTFGGATFREAGQYVTMRIRSR